VSQATAKRVVIRLHAVQAAFCRSRAPVRGFLGGRGAGKSHCGALDLIARAQPGRLYLAVAPTYTILQDATFRTVLEVGRSLGAIDPACVKASVPPSIRLTTGAEVIFRSGDFPDRLRGPNVAGCWLDEASQMPHGERGWLSATFTPNGLSHWTYDVFGHTRPDVETFHAATRMNPFLPAGFEHDVRLQYGTGLRAAQELDGRFVAVEGAEWAADYFHDGIWFLEPPAPATIVRSVLAIDPSKGKLKGDFQALVLARLDTGGTFWVDAEAARVDEVRLLALALELIERWNPDVTVVETNGAGYYLLGQIARASVRGLRPAVIGRHHGSDASKQARINTRLTSLWARGNIRLRKGSPGTRLLVEQARDFPEGEFDDLLDALEMGVELHGQLVLPKDRRMVHYEIPRY
jgi:phage terminase large subunit-like protein